MGKSKKEKLDESVVIEEHEDDDHDEKPKKKRKKEKKDKKKKKEKTVIVEDENADADNKEVELKETEAVNETEGKNDNENDEDEGKKKRNRKRKRKKKKTDDEDDKDEDDNDAELVLEAEDKKAAEVDRTLYVEGIPFDATPDDVRIFFDGLDIVDLRLPVWHDSGRLRGYGHVVLKKEADVSKVLNEYNGKYLNGRYLKLQKANKPKQSNQGFAQDNNHDKEPSKTIQLNNLSYQATEEDIETVCEKYGTIASGGVRVVRHSSTGRSKGFAYVEYESIESAKKCMAAANRLVICQRPCRVDYDHGRVKGSFRTADRKLWQKEYGNK